MHAPAEKPIIPMLADREAPFRRLEKLGADYAAALAALDPDLRMIITMPLRNLHSRKSDIQFDYETEADMQGVSVSELINPRKSI